MFPVRASFWGSIVATSAIGCSSGHVAHSGNALGAPSAAAAPVYDAGGPGPVPDGYQRFWTDPVDVPAGGDLVSAQWVAAPLDQTMDVVDVLGWQGAGGHHAIMYATTDVEPVGTSRPWRDSDQIPSRMVGGVGGEGGATVKLPPGVVFRIAKGSALMIQTHYLNAGASPISSRSALDLKLAPMNPANQVASLFASTSIGVNVTPGKSMLDVTCHVQRDLQFLMIANHMHSLGTAISTEEIDPISGQTSSLKNDPTWLIDWQFNPILTHYPVPAPLVVPQGAALHTHCEWENGGSKTVSFPDEMCVFFGFVLGDGDVTCTDDIWYASAPQDAGAH